ncbi:uncharacterized protein EI90DRAFT_3196614, partial [Cantharellus anzutake]|uniref:uncharacterized protein n=1 Tax=Cantharellus anzutake TaxID=1750568 RepID=UPI001906B913
GRSGDVVIQALNDLARERGLNRTFLDSASGEEKVACVTDYLSALSNAAVKGGVCGCCGRDIGAGAWMEVAFADIPNVHHLEPHPVHEGMQLTSGLLVIKATICETEEGAWYMGVCYECLASLKRNKKPLFSLMNGLWVGDIPDEIADLTIPEQMLLALVYPHCFMFKMHPVNSRGIDPDSMQRGMVGNVMSYDMDTGEIIDMLEGRKMPRRTQILSSVITMTYLG